MTGPGDGSFIMFSVPNKGWFSNVALKLVVMATSLKEPERNSDRSSTNKYLPSGEIIVKIGPADREIILCKERN